MSELDGATFLYLGEPTPGRSTEVYMTSYIEDNFFEHFKKWTDLKDNITDLVAAIKTGNIPGAVIAGVS